MNRIKKAIMMANKPIASVKAKPKIAYPNNSFCNLELRTKDKSRLPKTIPTPTPAPIKPLVARPEPTIFADFKIISLREIISKIQQPIPYNKKIKCL